MPALVAGIHVLNAEKNKDMDCRNKSGHDELLDPKGWLMGDKTRRIVPSVTSSVQPCRYAWEKSGKRSVAMKTLVNEICTEVAYHMDGHLVHTDKRTEKQTVSFQVWPDIASADRTLAEGLGRIQWEEVDEF